MKASEYKSVWNGDEQHDELCDYIKGKEGTARLKELDSHWSEVMDLAERYGFIAQAFGGVATLATHESYIDQLGIEDEAERLRMCNVELGDHE